MSTAMKAKRFSSKTPFPWMHLDDHSQVAHNSPSGGTEPTRNTSMTRAAFFKRLRSLTPSRLRQLLQLPPGAANASELHHPPKLKPVCHPSSDKISNLERLWDFRSLGEDSPPRTITDTLRSPLLPTSRLSEPSSAPHLHPPSPSTTDTSIPLSWFGNSPLPVSPHSLDPIRTSSGWPADPKP